MAQETRRQVDPILLEVFHNAVTAVGEEMAATMKRTARSIQARNGDCSTIITDAVGQVVAQGQGAQFHMGYAKAVMPHVLRKWSGKLRPGDMIGVNDPYQGLSHLPDIVLVAPVFWHDQIVAFATIVTHHSDMGGRFPGGQGSASGELYEEGLRLPNIKLVENDKLDAKLLDVIAANVRAPDDVIGDIEGQAAACRRGIRGLLELVEKYGIDIFNESIAQLKEYTERIMRGGISKVPDGDYSCQEYFEEDGQGGPGLDLKVTVKVRGDSIIVDFTGTDPQAHSAVNVPWGMTCSAVYVVIRCVFAPNAPTNAGIFAPIEVIAPEGCLVNPRFPGAVGGRGMMLYRITDMIFAALGQVMPGKISAEGEGGISCLTYIPRRYDTNTAVLIDWYFGGWGARSSNDGIDGAAALVAGSGGGNTPTEIIETEYPILLDGIFFMPDTGGAGKYRGALSLCHQFRFLRDGRALLRTGRSNSVPHGLAGGGEGTPFKAIRFRDGKEEELPRRMFIDTEVKAGDSIMHMLPGAGAYGDVMERDPQLVLNDVLDEKISPGYAEKVYGVAVDLRSETVDMSKTERLRNSLRRA